MVGRTGAKSPQHLGAGDGNSQRHLGEIGQYELRMIISVSHDGANGLNDVREAGPHHCCPADGYPVRSVSRETRTCVSESPSKPAFDSRSTRGLTERKIQARRETNDSIAILLVEVDKRGCRHIGTCTQFGSPQRSNPTGVPTTPLTHLLEIVSGVWRARRAWRSSSGCLRFSFRYSRLASLSSCCPYWSASRSRRERWLRDPSIG